MKKQKQDQHTFTNHLPEASHRWLALMVLILIGSTAAASFTLSFETQRTLAVLCGIEPRYAWLVPISIDVTLLALSLTAVLKRLDHKSIVFPVFVVFIAFALTVFFNIYQAPEGFLQALIPLGIVSVMIHAAAPVLLLLQTEGLISVLKLFFIRQDTPLDDRTGTPVTDIPAVDKWAPVPQTPDLEMANQAKVSQIEIRRQTVAQFLADGVSPQEMADKIGVARKTIERDLKVIAERSPAS